MTPTTPEPDPLEVGDRVRYFTPQTCWYHGAAGVVIGRKWSTIGSHYVYTVQAGPDPGHPSYLCRGAVYGVEAWKPRRATDCGFPCRVSPV